MTRTVSAARLVRPAALFTTAVLPSEQHHQPQQCGEPRPSWSA
ncbi:hypothetical protein [Micromonospora sagamiensis]|nr:hypothetical protein [Micromonospora sagamiensis]